MQGRAAGLVVPGRGFNRRHVGSAVTSNRRALMVQKPITNN